MKNELFELAVEAALRIPPKDVIGTKSEHRIHGAMKYYFQPCDDYHEARVDSFICDATDSEQNEIIEVQTRAFDRLKKKLSTLLLSHPVTIVYPVVVKKRIIATYAESGESHVRCSPKKAHYTDVFAELYKIKEFISYPDLKVKLALITVDEYRVFEGTRAQKRPFQKPISVEKIPTELIDVITLTYPQSYGTIVPPDLYEPFYSIDLAKSLGVSRDRASHILHLMTHLGFVKRIGRCKKGYEYIRSHP